MKRYIRNATQDILAMATSRKEVGARIEDHTPQTIIALAQLYLFPNGNRVHWRKEVWEKFYSVDRFKGSNKLPDAQFILKNSWEVHKNNLDTYLKFAIGKEEDYKPRLDIDQNQFHNIVQEYFQWLANVLSTKGFVDTNSVRAELDELGLGEKLSV